ncbi:EF-hand calcium-binding domain-containing protein 13 [Tenrec ecaudatus]|uniref:EF-hand calcium-binding domain-containing protein 13 n=1 Tax=Tenrec ecaudatus TaxID=94439 RepID=UPI003F591CBF
MEAKIHLLCQAEEDVDVVDAGSHSLATNLPPINVYSKKYIKFSKTTEKKIAPLISPGFRGWAPEHTKKYETSVFLCEEKYTDKTSRKKSLQLHRTEVISSSAKLSKEKIAKNESSSCKFPTQFGLHKVSSSRRASSSVNGKKEPFSNLYNTLYDEVPQRRLYSQDLNALHKACTLFSKIQLGNIYVNDLPSILFTLKISISDSEMRRALKTIDIDAFQDALKIFSRIKDGKVATDEVISVLNNMGIFVALETVQEVIDYIHPDSNNMVDIGNVIFALEELQGQYEDISIIEEPELEETSLNKKMLKAPRHSQQFKKTGSFSSRQSETSLNQKLNRKTIQHHSKSMDDNDKIDFKSLRNTWQIKKGLDGVDTSVVGLQPSISKEGISLKKHPDKAEICDLKSKPQTLKSISSFRKSLDKSDISSTPKLKKPSVRRYSSPLKQISSKEKTAADTLENVGETLPKLKESYIAVDELQAISPSVGIALSEKELQKIVPDSTRNENEMVALDDVMSALLGKGQLDPKCAVVHDAIKTIDKIKNERLDYEDLNTCLQNLGVYLSKSEFEKTKELTEVDETRKVNFKEFVNNMMKNTERFSEKLLLPDAIETLKNLSQTKINVSDLWNLLSNLNNNLKKDEFLTALKQVTIDEDDKVQFEEFEEVVKNMHHTSKVDELKEVVYPHDLLEDGMIAKENLGDFLRNIGIESPKEEVEKILQSGFVSEDNTVNVKDCITALRDTQKFSNFMDAKKEVLSPNLKFPNISELKEAMHILSHADNGKIDVPNLKHALESFTTNVTEEDFNEALKHCDINENMEVDLKEFLTEIKENPSFKTSSATQLLLGTQEILQNDLIDISDLKTSLMDNEFHGANTILDEVLKHEPELEDGKMTIQELMTKISDTVTIPNDVGESYLIYMSIYCLHLERLAVAYMLKHFVSMGNLKIENLSITKYCYVFSEDKKQFYNSSINKTEDTVVSELQEKLNTIGIYLSDDKLQMTLEKTDPSRDVVSVKSIIRELANTDEFVECQRIEDAWNIISTSSDEKAEVKDLSSTLKSSEKPLNKEQSEVSPHFATDELFKDIENVDKIRNGKMPVSELSDLLSTGIPLRSQTFQEILRQASIDENSEVCLKQILETLDTRKPDPVFEAGKGENHEGSKRAKQFLQRKTDKDKLRLLRRSYADIQSALNIVSLMNSDKVQVNDLKDALNDFDIPVKPEEHKMLESMVDTDENGDISLKNALLALKSNKRFQDFREVNNLAKALDNVTNEKVKADDIKPILKGLGIKFSEEELPNLLNSGLVDDGIVPGGGCSRKAVACSLSWAMGSDVVDYKLGCEPEEQQLKLNHSMQVR